MSKSKQYKKKRESKGNIFVILIVVLVVLIVIAIVGTSVDNSKYNGLMKDYTEFIYGERENVKLQRITGYDDEIYANDTYAYYVDDDIIYDSTKNIADAEAFTEDSEAAAEILGTISQAAFYTYTSASDFSIDYDYVIAEATTEEVIGSEDAAAEMIFEYITALGEDYNICGLYLGLADAEYYYGVYIDVMQKQTVTLDTIKENLTATALTVEIETEVEGDAETEVEGDAETEVEDETEEAPADDAE